MCKSGTNINTFSKWSDHEKKLNDKYLLAKNNVHRALCGKFYIYLKKNIYILSI